MTSEEIFLAALGLPDEAGRAAYLEGACSGESALRRRVQGMLAAHFKEGAFLDVPIGEQLGIPRAIPPRGEPGGAGEGPEAGTDDLHFLEPSAGPDSLGRIGHYEVLEVLGRGGFGIVFRAFDEVLRRAVALKVLAPEIAATSPARRRFLREARSFARVRHENVVQVYSIEEKPLPYLVMEYIPGETLQQRIDRAGPLDAREIVRFGRQIADGLAAAHSTGLIHRDIKPGNLLIEEGRLRIKITDFGLARAADDASQTRSGVLAGTPMYMAPEQAKGEALDHRADVFSLGSVLYVMAAGRPPFRAPTTYAVLKRVVEDEPRAIREVIPEVPQWLCGIIAKLHAKEPADRYQAARDAAEVLADCEAQLEAHGVLRDFSRIPRRKPARGWARGWKAIAAGALLAPILALAVAEAAGLAHRLRGRRDDAAGAPAPRASPAPKELAGDFANSLGMKFNLIPAGTFAMGSPPEEIERFRAGASDDAVLEEMLRSEGPQHQVEITRPFFMGITEVTIGQFRRFVEANPGYAVGDDRWRGSDSPRSDDEPVAWITWQNAADFCHWLGEKEGRRYRLPTEAEWEYACRAGRSGRYCYGDDGARLERYAWSRDHSGGRAHPVGEKLPNAWGLYDMHGNLFELCQDRHDLHSYRDLPAKDPLGLTGICHVSRGGAWDYPPTHARSAFRSWSAPHERTDCIGFRVALEATTDEHPDGGEM